MLRGFPTRLGLIHRGWRYRLRVDPYELRWLVRVLRSGDSAIDVGAYKGAYTYWMRRCVGEHGHVFAFEPQPEPAAYLRRCVRAFGWRNVSVEEVALSSRPGRRPLLVPGHSPSPGASLVGASLPAATSRYVVRTLTIDGVMSVRGSGLRTRLLKLDVEGHELEVLRGAAETIERHRPLILSECEARHLDGGSVDDVFAHLESLGYRGFFFWRGAELDVAEFDPATHQLEGRRPYANNFVFVPEELRSDP